MTTDTNTGIKCPPGYCRKCKHCELEQRLRGYTTGMFNHRPVYDATGASRCTHPALAHYDRVRGYVSGSVQLTLYAGFKAPAAELDEHLKRCDAEGWYEERDPEPAPPKPRPSIWNLWRTQP